MKATEPTKVEKRLGDRRRYRKLVTRLRSRRQRTIRRAERRAVAMEGRADKGGWA